MNNPLYREKLERQIESAVGNIEIIDGVIIRWMPECTRKSDTSSVFGGHYYFWARQQGGKFGVGNGGFTFGNTMRAPDAYFHLAGNKPPSTQRLLTPTAHPPNLIIETEHEGMVLTAEQKITNFWFQNGVQEAWLLVIPDIEVVVPLAPGGVPPPVPLPVVQMTQDRPAAPYIAIYIEANNPQLLGYFPINWHTEFQPPAQSMLFGAPPINCDMFMELMC
jgi:Uma2 family endonuclease